jgi:hypothetical protein
MGFLSLNFELDRLFLLFPISVKYLLNEIAEKEVQDASITLSFSCRRPFNSGS